MESMEFLKVLGGQKELRITTTGRRTGRSIETPVWFVLEGNVIHLLPVKGSDTNWYKNVMANRMMVLKVGRKAITAEARPMADEGLVARTIELFGAKYGRGEIKRWYTKLDVAVHVPLET